jgi:hypothetical protein
MAVKVRDGKVSLGDLWYGSRGQVSLGLVRSGMVGQGSRGAASLDWVWQCSVGQGRHGGVRTVRPSGVSSGLQIEVWQSR